MTTPPPAPGGHAVFSKNLAGSVPSDNAPAGARRPRPAVVVCNNLTGSVPSDNAPIGATGPRPAVGRFCCCCFCCCCFCFWFLPVGHVPTPKVRFQAQSQKVVPAPFKTSKKHDCSKFFFKKTWFYSVSWVPEHGFCLYSPRKRPRHTGAPGPAGSN